jgi:mycothiol synthase
VIPSPRELAALVRTALPGEQLTAAELEVCCYGPDIDVIGTPEAAAAFTVKRFGHSASAWLLLVAVHPDCRRQGRARSLLATVAQRARQQGASELHLGNCAPRYVWPGVDFRFTEALALFEAQGFEPYGAECNMTLPTHFRALSPAGVVIEREEGGGAVGLARRRFQHWLDETARAVEAGTSFAARAEGETVGFACHSVNRMGWVGPMATDPRRQHAGVGRALLGALCSDLEARGHGNAEIAWVAPVAFYAKCGAHVSRVFRVAKLEL